MGRNLTDEQLMTRVKNGDLDALAPLFEKYHVPLFNFFLRKTRNGALSEDLTQNVFQCILNYRKTYNDVWLFKTWMYQIARNAAAKHYNNQKLITTDYDSIEEIEFEGASPADEMDKEQQKNYLNKALERLPAQDREILELARFQGLKYKEIADIMGNTVPAIKVKVHRAMHKLRVIFFELA